MLTLFQQIQDGRLGWLDTLTYRDSLLYAGEDDLLGKLRDSTPVPLAQVALLMITTSDNTASPLAAEAGRHRHRHQCVARRARLRLDTGQLTHAGTGGGAHALRLGPDDATRDGGAAGHDPGAARGESRRRPGDVPDAHAHLLERRGAVAGAAVGPGGIEAGGRRPFPLRGGARERAVRRLRVLGDHEGAGRLDRTRGTMRGTSCCGRCRHSSGPASSLGTPGRPPRTSSASSRSRSPPASAGAPGCSRAPSHRRPA